MVTEIKKAKPVCFICGDPLNKGTEKTSKLGFRTLFRCGGHSEKLVRVTLKELSAPVAPPPNAPQPKK